jgi:hypothetical protein
MSYDVCHICGDIAHKTTWIAGKGTVHVCRRHAMPAVVQATSPPEGRAGRNWPCPCGSGKKYKFCCLRAAYNAAQPQKASE